MCHDCNPLETNTGLVTYSGPTLTLCTGKTITNGESMTSVIEKIQYCIDVINQEIDITGLVESSSCITLLGTSIKDVLQSILNTESAFCTQLADLQAEIDLIWDAINGSPTVKNVSITSCNPTFDIELVETPTQKTFKLGAFVPKKTILPYFGDISDFFSSGPQAGLGKPSAGLSGWAIADGRNGTINACGRYLKYDCAGCCQTGGSNTIELKDFNIPEIPFSVDAEFALSFTGETDIDGKHRHYVRIDDNSGCPAPSPDVPAGDDNVCANLESGANNAGNYPSASMVGASGEHSHTFSVDTDAQGTFSSVIGNPNPTPLSIEPEYIAGIPIQFIGC